MNALDALAALYGGGEFEPGEGVSRQEPSVKEEEEEEDVGEEAAAVGAATAVDESAAAGSRARVGGEPNEPPTTCLNAPTN